MPKRRDAEDAEDAEDADDEYEDEQEQDEQEEGTDEEACLAARELEDLATALTASRKLASLVATPQQITEQTTQLLEQGRLGNSDYLIFQDSEQRLHIQFPQPPLVPQPAILNQARMQMNPYHQVMVQPVPVKKKGLERTPTPFPF